jgi:hypothetical protein
VTEVDKEYRLTGAMEMNCRVVQNWVVPLSVTKLVVAPAYD